MRMFSLNANRADNSVWSVPVRMNARKIRVPAPAPSLRLPVTRANRERLRALRAAEAEAWNKLRSAEALAGQPLLS